MPPLICKTPKPERQDRAISDASIAIYRLKPVLDIRADVYFEYLSQGKSPADHSPAAQKINLNQSLIEMRNDYIDEHCAVPVKGTKRTGRTLRCSSRPRSSFWSRRSS